MARNDDGNRVSTQGLSHRTTRSGVPDIGGEFLVGRGRSVGHLGNTKPNSLLKCGSRARKGQGERLTRPVKVLAELLSGFAQECIWTARDLAIEFIGKHDAINGRGTPKDCHRPPWGGDEQATTRVSGLHYLRPRGLVLPPWIEEW